MGQHKHNQTAIAAAKGERRLTKRQAERLLKAEILSRCMPFYALPPELQQNLKGVYGL